MTGTRTGIIAVRALASLLAPLPAQQPSSLTAGQRVRVTAPSAGLTREVGTLVSVQEDSLVVVRTRDWVGYGGVWRADTVRMAVLLGDIGTLEVSRGRGSPMGPAVLGAIVGGIVGGLIGGRQPKPTCGRFDYDCGMFGDPAFKGGVIGVLVGGGLGMLLGSATSEKWAPAPLDSLRGLRIGIAPQPRGRFGLGASLAF